MILPSYVVRDIEDIVSKNRDLIKIASKVISNEFERRADDIMSCTRSDVVIVYEHDDFRAVGLLIPSLCKYVIFVTDGHDVDFTAASPSRALETMIELSKINMSDYAYRVPEHSDTMMRLIATALRCVHVLRQKGAIRQDVAERAIDSLSRMLSML